MSRSTRKPYAACSGKLSAHRDKTFAARAYRRKEKESLRHLEDPEDYIHPVRYEAAANDVWGWNRDGKQYLHFPPKESDETWWYEYQLWYYEYLKRK